MHVFSLTKLFIVIYILIRLNDFIITDKSILFVNESLICNNNKMNDTDVIEDEFNSLIDYLFSHVKRPVNVILTTGDKNDMYQLDEIPDEILENANVQKIILLSSGHCGYIKSNYRIHQLFFRYNIKIKCV